MEEALHQKVVGQDEAVHAVSDAIRRSRARAVRSESALAVDVSGGELGFRRKA